MPIESVDWYKVIRYDGGIIQGIADKEPVIFVYHAVAESGFKYEAAGKRAEVSGGEFFLHGLSGSFRSEADDRYC